MRGVEWIVLDDMKMNLIAALIVLILAANFTKAIELPFKLTEVEKTQAGSGTVNVRASKILINRENNELMITLAEHKYPLNKAKTCLSKLNPVLPVILAVEQESGLSYNQLIKILAILKAKGVRNVSLLGGGF